MLEGLNQATEIRSRKIREVFLFLTHSGMDGVAGNSISWRHTKTQVIVSGNIFVAYHLMPRGRKNHLNFCTFFLLFVAAGIAPGPPAPQASGPSISPLPLSICPTH